MLILRQPFLQLETEVLEVGSVFLGDDAKERGAKERKAGGIEKVYRMFSFGPGACASVDKSRAGSV